MPHLVLKSCIAGGERRNAGDIVDLTPDEAAQLSAMGRVEVAPEPKPKPKAETNRSVGLKASKASPVKKRGKKDAD